VLTLFLVSSLFILAVHSSFLVYVVVILALYFYYLANINMFFNTSLSLNMEFFLNDEVSIFISLLLFFIIFISYISSISVNNSYKIMRFVLFTLFFVCFQVFNTCHLFSLYFFYEASLVPILYIIIK